MNLKDLAVISGLPGVQRVVATRSNGVMAQDIDSEKVRFAPARKHQVSPLESISIFTDDNDALELSKVFEAMLDKLEALPLPDTAASSEEMRAYFSEIVPNHDRNKVHLSDIRKILRWFAFLHERGFITAPAGEDDSPPDEPAEPGESTSGAE